MDKIIENYSGDMYVTETVDKWITHADGIEDLVYMKATRGLQYPLSLVVKAGWRIVDQTRFDEIVNDYHDFQKYTADGLHEDAPEWVKALYAERERLWAEQDERNRKEYGVE